MTRGPWTGEEESHAHRGRTPGPRTARDMDRMNTGLKREHFKKITDPVARRMYNRLCGACEQREDGMTDPDQMLVADVAYAEQLKQLLIQDVEERGIGQERRNGRQVYWQENKSPAQIRAITEQQRKHLAELKLTPAKRHAAAVGINDDFDDFPD